MKAVLEAEAERTNGRSRPGSAHTSITSFSEMEDHHGELDTRPDDISDCLDPCIFRRPDSMEHMLTEDGEPMLNPGWFIRI